MTEEIRLINKIIVEAIFHGADNSGSYDSNEDDLIESITDWLEFKGLDDEYEARETWVDNGFVEFRTIQICKAVMNDGRL